MTNHTTGPLKIALRGSQTPTTARAAAHWRAPAPGRTLRAPSAGAAKVGARPDVACQRGFLLAVTDAINAWLPGLWPPQRRPPGTC